MGHQSLSELLRYWARRLDALAAMSFGDTGLECSIRCTGRCCPHAAMAERESAYTVSRVAIMLPFELERIVAHTGIERKRFRQVPVEVAFGTTIDIGIMDVEHPCPFLSVNYDCTCYAFRPVDCRSFPLIPTFGAGGEVGFRLDTNCPSAHTFSEAYQSRAKAGWRALAPYLSAEYRRIYSDL